MARSSVRRRQPKGAAGSRPLSADATQLGSAESGNEFARIDLVSNHTVFANPENYRALMRGEALPVETYSSFIHEATHHWCFTSPLGTALSLLYLSVAKKAFRWMCIGDDAKLQETLDDLFVFDAAIKWLRPLSEGLAQLAEYDVLPPESHVLTSPPTHATLLHLFNLPQRVGTGPSDDPSAAYYKLADDIGRWRLSRTSIDRKSNLLLEPVDPEKSCYLLGYLAVKQIWRSARRFYDELKDADLFMMFLRKFVYGDYALVAALLDRGKLAPHRALNFGKALYERLDAVRNVFFDEDVPWSEWEKILATPSAEESLPIFDVADGPPFIAMDTEELVAKGRELQFRYFEEVAAPLDFSLDRVPLFPPDYFSNVLEERHLMWLGDVPAKWVSLGPQKGRIVVAGEVLYDNYELTKASDEGLDDLRLDIYIDLYGQYQVTTIGNEHGVFGFAGRHLGDKSSAKLVEIKLNRREIAGATSVIHTLVDLYARRSNYHDVIAAFWQNGGRDLLDKTYRGYAFNFNKDAEKIVSERGIAEILENNPDLIRSVAAISLAASAGLSPEGLQSSSLDLTINPSETIRQVGTLWIVDNLPLAGLDDDGFLDSAF